MNENIFLGNKNLSIWNNKKVLFFENDKIEKEKKMAEPVEDYEANKKAVEAICNEPANSECADCGANGTRWATVNHGQFVCIRCSGIHRSLGVHISKVKSTNLDKWTSAEVAVMRMVGNKLGRQLFESRLPSREKPSEADNDNVVKEFIIKKYDEKKYSAPDWVPALKKVFKTAGYKAGKKGLKDAESAAPAATTTAAAAASTTETSKKDKKSKKDKSGTEKVVGVFGTVNIVPADQHDSRLATVLMHFGIAAPVAVTAAATTEAAAEGEKTEAVVEEQKQTEGETGGGADEQQQE